MITDLAPSCQARWLSANNTSSFPKTPSLQKRTRGDEGQPLRYHRHWLGIGHRQRADLRHRLHQMLRRQVLARMERELQAHRRDFLEVGPRVALGRPCHTVQIGHLGITILGSEKGQKR